MSNCKSGRSALGVLYTLAALALCFALPNLTHAQATVGTGNITGTILDPNGASVSTAKVTITSKATGQRLTPSVTDAGDYNSGSLTPGEYTVRIEAAGFKTVEKRVTVQVGLVASGNVTLEIGESNTVVTVEASGVQVNTEQAIVSGVLTTQQIENLPINGRNFLDLAQLEPGVQIQDGSNFDPTKTGFSSISFGGRFGRTARILVDGVDISDETVGTTTTNIPASALQEFQLSQSSLDLSNDLTSSGSVNVVTRSGTNEYHGQAFGLFRDSSMAAALPGGGAPFQRSQFGGNFGGRLIKDKLFFFADGERTKQDLFNAVVVPSPFDQSAVLSSTKGYSTPYREGDLLGKLDYNATQNLKLFGRFTYFSNSAVSPASFSPFDNKDVTRTFLVGADWNKGSWTHSVRFEYLKFHNQIVDATGPLNLPFSNLGVFILFANSGLTFGPNILAPQETPQSDHDLKYDGSKTFRSHTVRFGVSINHVQGGGFAKFFSLAPRVANFQDSATAKFFAANPGLDQTNPANYPVETSTLGNGLGFGTEKPSFGNPAGGLGPDNRFAAYIGDSWKFRSNLTLSVGLRYVRDTGRTDSDLNNASFSSVVNSFFPGLGNRVHQANLNFAPQAGVAWDPFKNGKTVVRAGIGIYYENVIFNNVLFDRPFRLANGAFAAFPRACNAIDTPAPVPFADGTTPTAPVGACGNGSGGGVTIASAAPLLAAFQQTYQQNTLANGGLNAANRSGYLPTLLQKGALQTPPSGFFDPNYQTPRALQMNLGVQRQVWKGGVLSADYLRNVGTHLLVGIDINHVGDSRFFNKAAATDAVARTLTACGVGSIDAAIASCPGLHTTGGVSIADFAANGLGVPGDVGVGSCITSTRVNFANGCAFGGLNPVAPSFYPQKSTGRSTYDALQVKFVQNVSNPIRGIRSSSVQISYSLSSYKNMGAFTGASPFASSPSASDLDFVVGALDNRNPFQYFGPGALDRKHQLSFGTTADLPAGFRVGLVGHFYSALPNTLFSNVSGGPGEIFLSDFTGDGSTGDPLPGTHLGSFGRGISLGGLNGVISNYNSNVAGQPTPAGQVLIQNGIFTLAQLQGIGGVPTPIPLAPSDQVGMYGLRAFDARFGWVHKFHERISVEPSVSFFNMFNFANFDLPTSAGGVLSGTLNGAGGSLNGTNYAGQNSVRVGAGTGTFALGSPRVIEWGLKVTF